ncbi:MAG: hypothetical protein FWD34_04730 [Oscillospiraceae bacterium]|nr:hypothetical protein [Oscillospiraceae bacterium]
MRSSTRKVRELVIFALFGSIMFISHIAMQGLPNIHLVGMLTATFTLVYRFKALIPVYIYALLCIMFYGLSSVPYLYIWLPLWGTFMLAPKIAIPLKARVPVYMVLCALHGLSFGTLYAPFWAVLQEYSFPQTLAYIAAGLPFDYIHAVGNFAVGLLIVPLSELLKKLDKMGAVD